MKSKSKNPRPLAPGVIKKMVRQYRKETGEWPKASGEIRDGRTWSAADRWLKTRGSSISQLTVEMGRSDPKLLKLVKSMIRQYGWPSSASGKL